MFFSAIFLQFPLNKSLPGNCDTWVLITLANQLELRLDTLFTGEPSGRAMYPVEDIHTYGEATPGGGLLFLAFKVFGLPDYWTFYFFMSLLFAASAFALYRFAGLFLGEGPGSWFAGFAFMCSNMTFAHIDDSVLYFYFIPLTSAYYLIRYRREGVQKFLWYAAFLGGLQVYFSVYVFIYQSVLLACILLLYRPEKAVPLDIRRIAKAIAVYAILALPFVLYYLNLLMRVHFVDPFGRLYTASMTSLMPIDFIAALPENLIYGDLLKMPQNWGFVRHRNFTGILLLGLAIWGLRQRVHNRRLLLAVWVGGFILALGPFLVGNPLSEFRLPAPAYPFYTWLPILSFLRVTNRAYFLCLIVMAIFAGWSVNQLHRRFSSTPLLAAALTISLLGVHAIENIPMPFKRWPVADWITLPDEFRQFTASTQNEVFLHMPTNFNMRYVNWDSQVFADPADFVTKKPGQPELKVAEVSMFNNSWDNLFEYNRELIYMNWQSIHRQSTVNGVNGYFSTARMIYHRRMLELPDPGAIRWLAEHGVTAIAYHKDMELADDLIKLDKLEGTPYLNKVHDGNRLAVFRFNVEELARAKAGE
jgi:hypothetical protein